MAKVETEGKKRYYQQDRVGSAKYTISYHDGKKKHKDGSDFFDIQTFRNKKDLAKFVNALHKGGYKYGFGESVNEGILSIPKSELTYQLSIDYTGRSKPKITTLNRRFIEIMYGYKINPNDVIKSLKKVSPDTEFKHMKWSPKSSGGGHHKFAIKESVNEAKLNIRDLPSQVSEDPGDFEDWYDDGMKLTKKGKKLAPFSKSDERKLFNIVQMWQDAEGDSMFGGASSSDIRGYIKDIEKFLKQKGKVVSESVNEAFVVAYGKGPKPIKPAFAAYADKKMAQKFMADMKRDGFKVMMTQKKIKGIDEDKKQIVQLKKKVGKKEIKFYDALSKLEKKMGKKKYRDFLVKSLKDFKVNGNHYDYRTNAAAEEKLFQLAK